MSNLAIAFAFSLILIMISIVGGGIEFKEIKIPNLGIVPRVLTFLLGCAVLAVCLLRPEIIPSDQISSANVMAPASVYSSAAGELSYKAVSNADVGATFVFPNNVFSIDLSEHLQHRLLFVDGEGRTRIKITRASFVGVRDIKQDRQEEEGRLKGYGNVVTFVSPEKDWANWYIITGLNDNNVFYYRRWYLQNSIGSIEFTFPKGQSSLYDRIIATMCHDLVFNENAHGIIQ